MAKMHMLFVYFLFISFQLGQRNPAQTDQLNPLFHTFADLEKLSPNGEICKYLSHPYIYRKN